MFDLSGRTALVTGAGRGIGLGIAEALGEAGAKVAVNDYYAERAEAAARALGPGALAVAGDICDAASLDALAARLHEEWGGVDILVNNAGIPAVEGMGLGNFVATDEAKRRELIELNLFALMNCTHRFLDAMIERGFGRIINIVSEAWRVQIAGVCAYAAAKGGVVSFSRQLSGEVASKGVTVNCISLGLMDNVPDSDKAIPGIPCGRLGTPRDAAAAVRYFASEEAAWVSAQTLGVSGGVA